jgi:hypothetical protein
VDFIARNSYNPTWKSQNYGSDFPKQYPNPTDASNNNNMRANNGNVSGLERTFNAFMQIQTEQNNILIKITENHDYIT